MGNTTTSPYQPIIPSREKIESLLKKAENPLTSKDDEKKEAIVVAKTNASDKNMTDISQITRQGDILKMQKAQLAREKNLARNVLKAAMFNVPTQRHKLNTTKCYKLRHFDQYEPLIQTSIVYQQPRSKNSNHK